MLRSKPRLRIVEAGRGFAILGLVSKSELDEGIRPAEQDRAAVRMPRVLLTVAGTRTPSRVSSQTLNVTPRTINTKLEFLTQVSAPCSYAFRWGLGLRVQWFRVSCTFSDTKKLNIRQKAVVCVYVPDISFCGDRPLPSQALKPLALNKPAAINSELYESLHLNAL